MSPTSTPPDSSVSMVLEYKLTEDDVHRYCLARRAGKCWRCCRKRKVAMLMLAALSLFLFTICYHARGIRSATLAIGTTLTIVSGLTWARQSRIDEHLCRLARQMGLPEDFRLVVSPDGIIEEPEPTSGDPARSIPWSEVIEIRRVDGLNVLRLRQGGCLLFIPDRAFPTTQAVEGFGQRIQAWQQAALH